MSRKLILKNYFNHKLIKRKGLKKTSNFSKIFKELINEVNDKKKTINVLSRKYSYSVKFSQLEKFKKFKTIAIIGMGGSILGIEAIYELFKNKIKKKVFFFDNIDEEKLSKFKTREKISKVLFIIISKSGNTIETLSNSFCLNIMKKNAKNVILISEKKNNFLFNISRKLNLFHIEHNKYIGGRYSVLSEVGIVPAYLMGVDTKKLRSKILEPLKGTYKKNLRESSIKLSKFLKLKKFNQIILLNYSPDFEKFLFWLQQLIAESLGKKNKGFLPIISNVPKDHHSLLQLYLDGPQDKIFYVFSSDNNSKMIVNLSNFLSKNYFLNKKKLEIIKVSQRKALMKIFFMKKIPIKTFEIKKINEEVLGKLFSYFILETILIGKLANINPYDQPAVEKVKILTKKILNKKFQI